MIFWGAVAILLAIVMYAAWRRDRRRRRYDDPGAARRAHADAEFDKASGQRPGYRG